MNKEILLTLLLLSFICTNANALTDIEIEKLAAVQANCTTEHPCIISVTKEKDKYFVKVTRSTLITPEGILVFRAGSVIYYIFNSDGVLEKVRPTT